ATMLASALEAEADVVTSEVAGPGFINLRLNPAVWQKALADILAAGTDYGRLDYADGDAVNVEYVSANPTGPMHVGHCRGAVVGDAIASLLDFTGHKVTREYYINDAGAQIDTLARSAHLRYREALGEDIGKIPAGLYPGDYLVRLGQALKAEFGDTLLAMDEAHWLPLVRDRAIDAMMVMIRQDLAALGIAHDVFSSERALLAEGRDRVAEAIDTLRARDLVYVGSLPPPKGQKPDDWEDREQTLFRSTDFGDDSDRALLKSDGSYTYFAADIAYHYDKHLRGFRKMIDVLGADHGGYAKRMKAAVTAISEGSSELEVQFCQLVKLFRAGEPVTMSKRSGEFVTLREVVDEVGSDAVRFMMLYRKADAPLDFDFQAVTEQSRDNPVFYVQYAHARSQSVRRQAAGEASGEIAGTDLDPANLMARDLSALRDSDEQNLIRLLAQWPRIVRIAAGVREPHRIAYYLYEVAGAFHALWNKGKELPHFRFINVEEMTTTFARLALVTAVGIVIRSGLAVLGVDAPDEMR
ncbi:MAG: arginine--tRNA ligase, partial [Alphaproteobacteria bacterium]